MNRLRMDSRWGRLNKEQRELLDQWLFDGGLAYKEILERAKTELGVTASLSSLKRYRKWAAQRHLLHQLTDGTAIARCPKRADGQRKYSHAMASRLAGMRAMDMFLGGPKQQDDLIAIMRLLIRDGATQGRLENLMKLREIKREELDFKRELAEIQVTAFRERNWLRQTLMEIKMMKNGTPPSASARVSPEKSKKLKGGTHEL